MLFKCKRQEDRCWKVRFLQPIGLSHQMSASRMCTKLAVIDSPLFLSASIRSHDPSLDPERDEQLRLAVRPYTYLRDRFRQKAASVVDTSLYKLPDGAKLESFSDLKFSDMQEARWLGIAAIEAFFGWTEHVLIHIGILLGNIGTGRDVARLAESEWSEKVNAAIDLISEKETKAVYEDLLEVRRQVRNYMAHGAFGKHGEAFQFHSATGAVPVNLTDPEGKSKFSMWSVPSFDEANALEVAESFITKLWERERAPAKLYLEEADLPVILSYASDGTYARAMSSMDDMENFVESLTHEIDNAANMDW